MKNTYFVCQQVWVLGVVLADNVSDTVVCIVMCLMFFVFFYMEKPHGST